MGKSGETPLSARRLLLSCAFLGGKTTLAVPILASSGHLPVGGFTVATCPELRVLCHHQSNKYNKFQGRL